MEDITFSARLNGTEGSTLELIIRKHWLPKKSLNNSALQLNLVMTFFDEAVGGCRESFYN